MTGAELITAVLDEGGFDTTRAKALAWLNQRYGEMVAGAKWRKAEVQLFTTVANQGAYSVGDDVVDIDSILVSDPTASTGYAPYKRFGARDIFDIKAGTSKLSGPGGIFAPQYTPAGVHQVQLYPVPTTSGLIVTGLVALLPADLTDGATAPIIPADFHAALRDGAISTGLGLLDERLDLAAAKEQNFQAAKQDLRRRANSRIGSGPHRIQVVM